jgi:hypothetical protein
MATQQEKAQTFRALHEREGAFVIPNPWDIGSARLDGCFYYVLTREEWERRPMRKVKA